MRVFFVIGSLLTISSPIIAVVSCSEKSQNAIKADPQEVQKGASKQLAKAKLKKFVEYLPNNFKSDKSPWAFMKAYQNKEKLNLEKQFSLNQKVFKTSNLPKWKLIINQNQFPINNDKIKARIYFTYQGITLDKKIVISTDQSWETKFKKQLNNQFNDISSAVANNLTNNKFVNLRSLKFPLNSFFNKMKASIEVAKRSHQPLENVLEAKIKIGKIWTKNYLLTFPNYEREAYINAFKNITSLKTEKLLSIVQYKINQVRIGEAIDFKNLGIDFSPLTNKFIKYQLIVNKHYQVGSPKEKKLSLILRAKNKYGTREQEIFIFPSLYHTRLSIKQLSELQKSKEKIKFENLHLTNQNLIKPNISSVVLKKIELNKQILYQLKYKLLKQNGYLDNRTIYLMPTINPDLSLLEKEAMKFKTTYFSKLPLLELKKRLIALKQNAKLDQKFIRDLGIEIPLNNEKIKLTFYVLKPFNERNKMIRVGYTLTFNNQKTSRFFDLKGQVYLKLKTLKNKLLALGLTPGKILDSYHKPNMKINYQGNKNDFQSALGLSKKYDLSNFDFNGFKLVWTKRTNETSFLANARPRKKSFVILEIKDNEISETIAPLQINFYD